MLPFNCERQAARVRQDFNIPDKSWETRRKIIRAEHRLPDARTELRRLWKEKLEVTETLNTRDSDDVQDDILPFELEGAAEAAAVAAAPP